MQKSDRILLLAICLFAVTALGAASVQVLRVRRTAAQQYRAEQPQRLNVTSQQVIGDHPALFGDSRCLYTLVEFADYQCPPCRAVQNILPEILQSHRGRIRYVFRHFPLVDLHVYALSAATAAEAAREQGHYAEFHTALFAGGLEASDIEKLVEQQRLDPVRFARACKTSARHTVEKDLRTAESLHLAGTPTFILCCPDGRVIRLGALAQLNDFFQP